MRDYMQMIDQACQQLEQRFKQIDEIRRKNQLRVLNAFRNCGVEARHFYPSTGYGNDDASRDMLDRLFAEALGAQAALVRPHFASGTHVLSCVLRAMCPPDTQLVLMTGQPYDTIRPTIRRLEQRGVTIHTLQLTADGGLDLPAAQPILQQLGQQPQQRVVVYFQRSRGYAWRPSLSATQLDQAIAQVGQWCPHAIRVVDNCYGEFVDVKEPGADLFAGSLIKNPGGGLAPTGAYCAGRQDLVDAVADELFATGIGGEVGSYAASYLPFYQGLFTAPQVVADATKGALLAAQVFKMLGFESMPGAADAGDLVASIKLGTPKAMEVLCRAVQAASPVDSMAVPTPSPMPGYEDPVIMAAGTFIQGASIELSADGPIRPPYIVYIQGGLNFDHITIALQEALQAMDAEGLL